MGLDGKSYDVDDSRFIYVLQLLKLNWTGLLLNEPYFEENTLPLKTFLS